MQTLQSCEEADGFDYKSVPPSVEKFLRGQAERIQHGQAISIMQTGKSLIEAKRHLSHGQFLSWVVLEAGLHVRTAQAYMQVAQWAKGKSATVTRLPPSLLYLLSTPTTPDDFQAALLERLEAGERINVHTVRTELAALRRKQKQPSETADATIRTMSSLPSHTELVSFDHDHDASVGDAVHILSRALSPADFAQVRSIMTSKTVLESPHLSEEIMSAFGTIDNSIKDGIDGISGQYARRAA
jgi:predicted nucleic acid-binding protein